jgi:hypothetical protein
VSLEFWSTFASIATFVVVAITAIAALVQLRHIRRANQLAGLQNIFTMLQDPGIRELVNYVRHDLGERMKDSDFRQGLRAVPVDRREHPEFFLCDIYNHVGSFVRSGLIDESVYLQTDWYNVSLYWGLLRESIAEGRRSRPYIFENFEWLAARAQRWIEKHPCGDYPAGEWRMTGSTPKANARVFD